MGHLYEFVATESGWNYTLNLCSEMSKIKVWFPKEEIKEGLLTPKLLKSQIYFGKYWMPDFHARNLRTRCLNICWKQMWHCMTLAPDFLGNTRCRVWPDTEPKEFEATTYTLLLLSAPHNPKPYEVYLNSIRVSFSCQTPENAMLGPWGGMSLLLYPDLRMFNQVNLHS